MMENNNYNVINKSDNKVLYYIDAALDKFVVLTLTIIGHIIPKRFQNVYEGLLRHKDMLNNVIGLAFFNMLGGVCVMATQVKLANYLGASVYGLYSYCLAIGEVGAMFVRYGRNKTMVRDLIQYPEKRDSLIVGTFWLSVINLSSFLIVVFLCHAPLDIEVSWTYFLLILSPCFASFSLGPVYESIRMMSWNSIYSLLQKFCFLMIIWTLFFLKYDVGLLTIGVLVVISWISVIFMEYYEVGTQLHVHFVKRIKFKDIWQLYKENFVIFLSCATGVAFGPLLRLVLNNYADSSAVGIYAAGLQIYNICLFLNTQISRVGNPMMVEAGKDGCPIDIKRRLISRYVIVMFVTGLPFAIPMLFCPNFLTHLLFTEEYYILAKYLPILAIYLVIVSVGVVFEQYMISIRMDKSYFTIYVSYALATIILSYIWIPRFGVLGAFLSLCIPRCIGFFLYFLCSIKSLIVK